MKDDADPFGEKAAVDIVRKLLSKPSVREGFAGEIDPNTNESMYFEPWDLFENSVYGHYSSDFDQCAIDVLDELITGKKVRTDLGADMFREMLCVLALCDYGSSPRRCFPTQEFKTVLPKLIGRWKAYAMITWSDCAEIAWRGELLTKKTA